MSSPAELLSLLCGLTRKDFKAIDLELHRRVTWTDVRLSELKQKLDYVSRMVECEQRFRVHSEELKK